MFQSSPGLLAGCNKHLALTALVSWSSCFNPHPARRPGATSPTASVHLHLHRDVSILTRPEGRVQRSACGLNSGWRSCFNPHPARRPGATSPECLIRDVSLFERFQSSPGQKAGCNCRNCGRHAGLVVVSILTRPEGRVQPLVPIRSRRNSSFNPHPARRPGATRGTAAVRRRPWGFNPHPARRPGATPEWPTNDEVTGGSCFNPHPARRPGATPRSSRPGCVPLPVSILTRPEGRVQPRQVTCFECVSFLPVSILTRPEGRVQHLP